MLPTSSPSTPNLTIADLTLPKEKSYYRIALILSLIAWFGLAITIVGIFYAAMFGFIAWLGNGLLTAYLRAEAVEVSERQLPQLHKTFLRACEKLGVARPPRLYVIQAGGILNAFATRFSGRDFVVVYSDMLEAYGADSPEIQFVLGHELGHLKSNHIFKRILLLPGMLFPLLGPAYLRACEASCDRHGAFASDTLDGAIRAMLILSAGKEHGRTLDASAFASQHYSERGFFVSWHELTSGYPTLSQRVALLQSLGNNHTPREAPRSGLAYLFALFTPGGQFSAAPNMMVFIVIIGLLAAMAIPAFQKVRQNAEHKTCLNYQRMIASAYEQAEIANGRAPSTYDDFIGPGKALESMPVCPSRGQYAVIPQERGGCTVQCSVHDHTGPSVESP